MTMRLTLKVDHEVQRPKYENYASRETVTETETLCDISDQAFSTGMLAAALRQLADEVDPRTNGTTGGLF